MKGDFRIGGRLIRPRLNAIEYEGIALHLEPKVMQVLVALADQTGDVVTRQQIRETVWQNVFVGEDVLIRAISELRRAFQDDPRTQHTIQTVPKVGYRLVLPVEEIVPDAHEDNLLAEVASTLKESGDSPQPEPENSSKWLTRKRIVALSIGVVALLVVGLGWGFLPGFWGGRMTGHYGVSAQAVKSVHLAEAVVPATAGRCPILSGAIYELENKHSGSVLEVPISSASNGTLLHQWKSNSGNNQRWVVTANGAYWTFTNVSSGKLLDDPSANRALGVQVDQWQANHAPNQNWILLPVGDGTCKVISQSSGLLLDVDHVSTANGAAVIQYSDNDGPNQHWYFRLVKKQL